MAFSPDALRIALLTRIEFGPETRRPLRDRLAERLPALQQAERDGALGAALHVVSAAERLVREFRAGERSEDGIRPALLESFPWLGAGIPQVQSPHALPAEDLTSHVRAFAYYIVMK